MEIKERKGEDPILCVVTMAAKIAAASPGIANKNVCLCGKKRRGKEREVSNSLHKNVSCSPK